MGFNVGFGPKQNSFKETALDLTMKAANGLDWMSNLKARLFSIHPSLHGSLMVLGGLNYVLIDS